MLGILWRLAATFVVAGLLILEGCTGPARVVLDVDSAVADDVVQLDVGLVYQDAGDGDEMTDSVRAPDPAMILSFPVSMSLSLPSWADGTLLIDVAGVDAGNVTVGAGAVSVTVVAGQATPANVLLVTP